MRLSKLIEKYENVEVTFEGEWDREIADLAADSREVRKNSLFFCLKGSNVDGHTYAKEAVKKGAVAVVTERKLSLNVPQIIVKDTREALGVLSSVFFGEPSKHIKVIGITGTNGKTTTSYMLASILRSAGEKVGVIGTLGVSYGRKSYLSELTTPDPIALQRTLADMRICGMEYAVMEVSAHALFYKKTAGIRFAACIFTNLSQDHLDFFGSMSSYKAAKSLLFDSKVCPLAILNGDEECGREFGKIREKQGGKTLFYGLNTPAEAFAVVTDEALDESECMFNINDKLCRVKLFMTGRYNIYNALAASVCAVEFGASDQAVSVGLASFKGVSGRLERLETKNGADVFVDFAHTPDGLEKSLEALRPHCKGRLICLFGCGGNRDKTKRRLMGEIAAKKSDFTILTSDNPRYEDPLDIITEIEKGYRRFSVRYLIVPDRKKAIGYGLDILQKGDILLVAGKGGERYQEIMGIKYPFEDHDTIINYLEKKGR